jgi:hypothetical protein
MFQLLSFTTESDRHSSLTETVVGGNRYNHPNALNTGERIDRGGGQLIRLNGTHKGTDFAMAGVILPKRAFGYHRLHENAYVMINCAILPLIACYI